MIDRSSQKRSLQITILNSEFKQNMHYFMTAEFEGNSGVRRRTDISAKVPNPVFALNKFFLPVGDETLTVYPQLIFHTFAMVSREENMTEEDIYSKAKLLGTSTIDMTHLIQEELGSVALSRKPVKRKLQFGRVRDRGTPEETEVVVGRATVEL